MKNYLLLLALVSGSVSAENLCDPIKSSGEGHWPIPEEAFTKQVAIKAAEDLKSLLSKADKSDDYFAQSAGIDFESAVRNNLVSIEGYMLKVSAENDLKEDNQVSKWSLKAWCDFLKTDAVIWH
uniref:hypothetical protein n=1 Tax=Microbulbifer agarilyticus TaxID=260552 RepID=UPI00111083C8|nr:hypothetical protein [Microbulbifer agarilyticus]